VIRATGLTKSFDGRKVLKGLDCFIDHGEIVALIGVNGAGKTTLIRILSTLMKPDSGSIRFIHEGVAGSGNSIRAHLGVVLHTPMVYGDLTGEENLRFFAKIFGLMHPQSRIEEVLGKVGLFARRSDLVRIYSRGMQQRLSIARAILHDPQVLLMDEPFTGLDQESSDTLGNLLIQFSKEGKSTLFTTHDLNRLQAYSTRVDLLHQGKIASTWAAPKLNHMELQEMVQSLTGKAIISIS
jgi:heme exporter protein A